LASSAMTELDHACTLFSKAAVLSRFAAKALPVLLKLSEKAKMALAQSSSVITPSIQNGLLWNIEQGDSEDELSIFVGRTRLVSTKRPSRSPSQPALSSHSPSSDPCRDDSQTQSHATSTSYVSDHRLSSLGIDGWVNPQRQSHVVSTNNPQTTPHYRDLYQHASPAKGSVCQSPGYQQWSQPPIVPSHDIRCDVPSLYPISAHQQDAGRSLPSLPALAPYFHHPSAGLVDLGLASRTAPLDRRWSSFMEDSGLLDGSSFASQ